MSYVMFLIFADLYWKYDTERAAEIVVKLLKCGADPNGSYLHFEGEDFFEAPVAMSLLAITREFNVCGISFLARQLLSFGLLDCFAYTLYVFD